MDRRAVLGEVEVLDPEVEEGVDDHRDDEREHDQRDDRREPPDEVDPAGLRGSRPAAARARRAPRQPRSRRLPGRSPPSEERSPDAPGASLLERQNAGPTNRRRMAFRRLNPHVDSACDWSLVAAADARRVAAVGSPAVPRSTRRAGLVFLGYTAVSFTYFGWRVAAPPGTAAHRKRRPIRSSSSGRSPGGRTRSATGRTRLSPTPSTPRAAPTSPGRPRCRRSPSPSRRSRVLFGPGGRLQPRRRCCCRRWPRSAPTGSASTSRARSGRRSFGGYLFGFSSFVLAQQLQGHLNLTGTFLLPLIVLAVVRFVQGTLTPRGLALRFGVLFALQFAISTEIAVTLTLALVLGVLLALLLVVAAARASGRALVPAARGRLRHRRPPRLAARRLRDRSAFRARASAAPRSRAPTCSTWSCRRRSTRVEGSSFPSLTAKFNEHESAIFLGVPLLADRRSSTPGAPAARPGAALLVVGLLLSLRAGDRRGAARQQRRRS